MCTRLLRCLLAVLKVLIDTWYPAISYLRWNMNATLILAQCWHRSWVSQTGFNIYVCTLCSMIWSVTGDYLQTLYFHQYNLARYCSDVYYPRHKFQIVTLSISPSDNFSPASFVLKFRSSVTKKSATLNGKWLNGNEWRKINLLSDSSRGT